MSFLRELLRGAFLPPGALEKLEKVQGEQEVYQLLKWVANPSNRSKYPPLQSLIPYNPVLLGGRHRSLLQEWEDNIRERRIEALAAKAKVSR